ncbi:MAG: fibrobacter succinogenes major paralogous domain-containing protein [Bacteroidales bacterium]|nr:fibrobacter succinogenes major paralogous domain-containing protein [Bacteroidales bacterium]
MKALAFIFVLALSFTVFAQQNTWPSALGNVSFATDSTWTISGNGIFQIWSDAVQTDYCSSKWDFRGAIQDTVSFNGADSLIFQAIFRGRNLYVLHLVDCRRNPWSHGDFFSWRAVHDLRQELCPLPWRVPTLQDFKDLHFAMGGIGDFINDTILVSKYLNYWGGDFGGDSETTTACIPWGHYWSKSNNTATTGLYFGFSARSTIIIGGWTDKGWGKSLRCVRDN